jgi:hypothetical protein
MMTSPFTFASRRLVQGPNPEDAKLRHPGRAHNGGGVGA